MLCYVYFTTILNKSTKQMDYDPQCEMKHQGQQSPHNYPPRVQNWMANMEHSKYLFNLKYSCSTFMELCLKQINRHTQFRDMQSAPGKKVGKKKKKKKYLPNSIPFLFFPFFFSQSHLKLFSEHVQPPYCTGRQAVQHSCSMPTICVAHIFLRYRK